MEDLLAIVIIMADDAQEDGEVFVYTGGDQVVPDDVVRVIIDKSVKIIPEDAFRDRQLLRYVEGHDEIERVGRDAFNNCTSLRGIKLPGVKVIEGWAFNNCERLTDVERCDKLETIGEHAFINCTSLKRVNMRKVRVVELNAFWESGLEDAEFGDDLERIGRGAFHGCTNLRRVAIPLKDGMFEFSILYRYYTQFDYCDNFATVDLVGAEAEGMHKTVAALHLESWRNEMTEEINRINQILPRTDSHDKANTISLWIQSVIRSTEHYKAEHLTLLGGAMTMLELALWKANLDKNKEDDSLEETKAKKAKIDIECARKEARITSGADIVIKNVLPFLMLE